MKRVLDPNRHLETLDQAWQAAWTTEAMKEVEPLVVNLASIIAEVDKRYPPSKIPFQQCTWYEGLFSLLFAPRVEAGTYVPKPTVEDRVPKLFIRALGAGAAAGGLCGTVKRACGPLLAALASGDPEKIEGAAAGGLAEGEMGLGKNKVFSWLERDDASPPLSQGAYFQVLSRGVIRLF